tara:strand:+ start:1700 stop:3178 length:1479 start_codon:yes stop_codon:yes gene_type:complete
MIFLEHCNGIFTNSSGKRMTLVAKLYEVAQYQPNAEFVVHEKGIDPNKFLKAIEGKRGQNILISNTANLNSDLGYVEDTPFIKVNQEVIYPTWKKSTSCFYIHAALTIKLINKFKATQNLLYWLNSVAKAVQSQGVLSYQTPLFKSEERLTTNDLYKFVSQHYKKRWIVILFLCHIIYEKRFPLFAFTKSVFCRFRNFDIDIKDIQHTYSTLSSQGFNYDIIIPTLGRSKFLRQVLIDISVQGILPKSVIIIEQSPEAFSKTDLDFIYTEVWPFKINHEFTNSVGACKSRNKGFQKTSAEWVLLFDDDLRVPENFLEDIQLFIEEVNVKAITFSCLQSHEIEQHKSYMQWRAFGSGCSIVHREIIEKCSFDLALEHGYGEDIDYGMQIRNAGYDVIYAPKIQLLHLKAPIGGFRSPHEFPWSRKGVSPKPSPQVMYNRIKNTTRNQLKGYKLTLFLKFYFQQDIKNPYSYYRNFQKSWSSSVKWAGKLPLHE